MELQDHFEYIRSLIRKGQARALKAAYEEQLNVYWSVGTYVVHRLTASVYGEKVVERLAEWLKEREPLLKGFDRRAIYRMRDFYVTWSQIDWKDPANTDFAKVVSKIKHSQGVGNQLNKIVGFLIPQFPKLLSRLSWSHHDIKTHRFTGRKILLFGHIY